MITAYKGHIVYTKSPEKLEISKDSYVIIEDGIVKEVLKDIGDLKVDDIIDYGDNMIIPGFVDLHFHAPQFPNLGLGLDKELLPWLTDYTFPEEAKFADIEYAKEVFATVIENVWRQGTTRVVFLSSLHKEASILLMDMLNKAGLGAYVGKVNMDRNSPDFLIEDTKQSLIDTEEILKEYSNKYKLVKPIITPRFVPTCTSELMDGLGQLASKYDANIQTHISENTGEVQWVKELHPESRDYIHVYEENNLINSKTVLAHCVHNTDKEIQVMSENGTFAAHCPNANYNLSSGIMPVRKFMEMGVNVGLGTDVGAGHKVSIANVMSQAVQASKMKWLETDKKYDPLTTSEVFYLGTKGGGKFFGQVGSFEPGYEFDALVIDDTGLGFEGERSIEERIQRYIYCGDDRNIVARYVSGNKVNKPVF